MRPLPLDLMLSAAWLAALCGCLSTEAVPGPTIRGHFGNRLEGLPPRALFDSSLLALRMMQERSGNSYTYQNGYGPGPLGGGTAQWSISVTAGVPVREEFESVGADGTTFRKVETSADWAVPRDAREQQLPEPLTLDSLYGECRALLDGCTRSADPVLGPPEPVFAYDADYILSFCGCDDPAWQDGFPSVSVRKVVWARP